jgi:hypothetical protein
MINASISSLVPQSAMQETQFHGSEHPIRIFTLHRAGNLHSPDNLIRLFFDTRSKSVQTIMQNIRRESACRWRSLDK